LFATRSPPYAVDAAIIYERLPRMMLITPHTPPPLSCPLYVTTSPHAAYAHDITPLLRYATCLCLFAADVSLRRLSMRDAFACLRRGACTQRDSVTLMPLAAI